MSKSKREILNDVVEYRRSWPVLSKELGELAGSKDGAAVRILPRHIISVLNRYAAGEFDALEVEEWANMIEMCEEIEYDPRSDSLIREIIWELANPQLCRKLSAERVSEIINTLPK